MGKTLIIYFERRKELFVTIAMLLAVVSLSGCSINRATATIDQTTDFTRIRSIHVVKHDADARGINELIANRLKTMGYSVTTGSDKKPDADAVVTYIDKWIWDFTVYMLELTVIIREPKTDFPLASGNSFHTSMSRKTPKEMVEEVLTNIFKQGGRS